jgi:hypothetical protein
MNRANYIGAPEFFDLNQACRVIVDAYGARLYLVGSSLVKRDYRDVDLRLILPDEDFAAMFPGLSVRTLSGVWLVCTRPDHDARWSLMCSSISLYLSKHSGLKVDFQVQQMKAANAEYPNEQRCAVGIFLEPKRP